MLYLGIDLGGTHIGCGLVNEAGEILCKAEVPTLAERPFEQVVRDMAQCALDLIEQSRHQLAQLSAVGIGIPGLADNHTGNVIFCTNLGWKDTPLTSELQRYLPLPVYIENDATVAGYAESVAGVSRNSSSSVFLTLGTGVGAGIVINGTPWTGAHGVASEIGHLTLVADGIPCTCGKNGCIERYCSATAIIRMAKEVCLQKPDCGLAKRVEGDLSRLSAKVVFDGARDGDEDAKRIFEQYCAYLTMTINNVISFLDPEVIVLGGGVSRAGDFLLNRVKEMIPQYLMYKTLDYADICLAELGNEAGIIGAAMLARNAAKGKTF